TSAKRRARNSVGDGTSGGAIPRQEKATRTPGGGGSGSKKRSPPRRLSRQSLLMDPFYGRAPSRRALRDPSDFQTIGYPRANILRCPPRKRSHQRGFSPSSASKSTHSF